MYLHKTERKSFSLKWELHTLILELDRKDCIPEQLITLAIVEVHVIADLTRNQSSQEKAPSA